MLTLRAGESSLVLAPETGGALLGWTLGGVPVLRRALPDAVVQGRVGGLAGFPLLPFCNRIAYGRFRWDGRDYQLDRNFGDHPHTIHGVGWHSAWTVLDASDSAVTLGLEHAAAPHRWPFAFAAQLRMDLSETGLQVRLGLTNRHDRPAPVGLGLHPFFPRASFQTLRFRAEGVWLTGPNSLPDRHEPVPADWDHGDGRPVGSVVLDHCFTGWDGTALLQGESLRLTIQADPKLRFVQVYTPAGMDFFCVEPVSHVPDAINRPGQGMAVLEPGERIETEIGFHLSVPGAA